MRGKNCRVFLLLLLFLKYILANDIYVSTTGTDDPQCGESISPCLTVSYAVLKSVDSDTIVIETGNYTQLSPITVRTQITIQSLNSTNTTVNLVCTNTSLFSIKNNVTFNGITIEACETAIVVEGNYVTNLSYMTFISNTIGINSTSIDSQVFITQSVFESQSLISVLVWSTVINETSYSNSNIDVEFVRSAELFHSTFNSSSGSSIITNKGLYLYIEDCYFQLTGTISITSDNNNGTFYIQNSTFDSNSQNNTIVFIASDFYQTLTVDQCQFIDSRSSIISTTYGVVNITNSTFTTCHSETIDYSLSTFNSLLTIDECVFLNNKNCSVVFNSGSAVISNSIFQNNTAFYGGLINATDLNLNIISTTFDRNAAEQGSAINYNAESHNLTISNSNFTRGYALGGGAIYYLGASFSAENTIFQENSALYGGALILLVDLPINFENCTFRENNAIEGSSIIITGNSADITTPDIILSCIFIDNYFLIDFDPSKGTILYVAERTLVINQCLFQNSTNANFGGAISITAENLFINATQFIGLTAQFSTTGIGTAPAIFGEISNFTSISYSEFINNTAYSYMINDGVSSAVLLFTNLLNIDNCIFKDNNATSVMYLNSAGALVANLGDNFTLTNTQFIRNTIAGFSSVFSGPTPASLYVYSENIVLQNSSFTDHEILDNFLPSISRGQIVCLIGSTVTIEGCSFSNNYLNLFLNALDGGILYVNSVELLISNTNFNFNTLIFNYIPQSPGDLYGGLISIESLKFDSKNITVTSNHLESLQINSDLAVNGGIISIFPFSFSLGAVKIDASVFTNNTFSLYAQGSSTTVKGGLLYISDSLSLITINDTKFFGNEISMPLDQFPLTNSVISGGALYLQNSYSPMIKSHIISYSQFESNVINYVGEFCHCSGAAIFGNFMGSNFTFDHTLLISNKIVSSNSFGGKYEGGAVTVISSNDHSSIKFADCQFNSNQITATDQFSIYSSSSGGALYSNGNMTILFELSFIEENKIDAIKSAGAAITCDNSNATLICLFQSCTFSNNTFSNNIARTKSYYLYENGIGGGIYFAGVKAHIQQYSVIDSTVFQANSATMGGAVFLQSNFITWKNVTFQDNFADQGGALFVYSCSSDHCDSFGTYIDNKAVEYGNDCASIGLSLISEFSHITVWPGQLISIPFHYNDCFDNEIGLSSNLLYININGVENFFTNVPSNILRTSPQNPIYEISSAYFIGEPKIIHTIDFLLSNNITVNSSITIEFSISECFPNYYYSASNSRCIKCESNQYSWGGMIESCSLCPPATTSCISSGGSEFSYGTTIITIGPGVWPSDDFDNPQSLLACPNPTACLPIQCESSIQPNSTYIVNTNCNCCPEEQNLKSSLEADSSSINQSPYCKSGYTSRMCSQCVCESYDNCWYIISDFQCKQCDNSMIVGVIASVICTVVILSMYFLYPRVSLVINLILILIATICGLLEEVNWIFLTILMWNFIIILILSKSISLGGIKIVINFLQTVQLLVLNIIWPVWFNQTNLGAFGVLELKGLQCVMPTFDSAISLKYFLSLCYPIFLFFFFTVIYLVISLIRRKFFQELSLSDEIHNESANENQSLSPDDFTSSRNDNSEQTTEQTSLLQNNNSNNNSNSNNRINMTIELQSLNSEVNFGNLKRTVPAYPFKTQFTLIALFLMFSTYLSQIDKVFSVLSPCTEEGYLRAFIYVPCSFSDSTYLILFITAFLFLFIYVIGIPLLFLGLLLYLKYGTINLNLAIKPGIEFLSSEYRPHLWFFEMIWIVKRLLLVIAINWISVSSQWQYIIICLILLLPIPIISVVEPYRNPVNSFGEIVSSITLLTFYTISENWELYNRVNLTTTLQNFLVFLLLFITTLLLFIAIFRNLVQRFIRAIKKFF